MRTTIRMETRHLLAPLPHAIRPWLNGVLAGLLALAAILAPAQHERMMLGREIAALAMAPERDAPAIATHDMGGMHDHRAPASGGHDHLGSAPTCYACLLMAVPGLPPTAFAGLAPRLLPSAVKYRSPRLTVHRPVAWASRHARAPPALIPG